MKKYLRLLLCGVLLLLLGMKFFKNVSTVVSNEQEEQVEKDYIKWVDFDVTCEAMAKACQYDIDTYGQSIHLNWVDLLACLGAGYGGDFSNYKDQDMEEAAESLLKQETTIEKLADELSYFSYYREAYGAVLDGLMGTFEICQTVTVEESEASDKNQEDSENENPATDFQTGTTEIQVWTEAYGLKAFHPIAQGFPYSDYDDFGASRSYGYKRQHLGHDMMGQVGTPVIAVESGYVSKLGWNQYGGWRIGINSFDGKRYYYYAHLRQNRPFAEGLQEGDLVQAGDVIGYMGRTGYSSEENVNNIDTYHLHFGLQLIFDESQREGSHEIWVSGYELVKFLYRHQSEVQRNNETKEWTRVSQIRDPALEEYRDLRGDQE